MLLDRVYGSKSIVVKMFESSDDYDFTPSGSSNLAALFGTSMTVQGEANTSLIYSPPKQPKPVKDVTKDTSHASPKPKQQSVVVTAKVITLYKLENDEYDTMGKHGLAIIKYPVPNNHEMIIYKEKTNIITRAKITNNFRFISQNDKFSSFFDSSNQNWLVKFETLEDKSSILKEIETLGGVIEDYENKSQGNQSSTRQIDTKSTRRKVSPKPNKKVNEIKFTEEELEETTIQKVNENENDSDSSQSRVKADILTRMAKMGQLLLPSSPLKADTTDMSDSDTTDITDNMKPPRKPRKFLPLKDKETVTSSYANSSTEEFSNPNSSVPVLYKRDIVDHSLTDETVSVKSTRSNRTLSPASANRNNALVVSQSAVSITGDSLDSYEKKRHDTEVKLDLLEISSKLDYLIKKSCLPSNTVNVPSEKKEDMLRSKLKVVQLRVENLTSELKAMQDKYSHLQENYMLIEQKLKTEEQKKNNIEETVIKQQQEKLSELEKKLEHTKCNVEELRKYKSEVEECRGKIDHLTELLESEKLKNKIVEENKDDTKIVDFATKQRTFNEMLKQRMNAMYEGIMMNISEGSSYTKTQIDGIVAQNIKRTTFQIMKDCEESMK